MSQTSPLVSVVLPVHRTAQFIDELHRRASAALAGHRAELVFVDDASPDDAASRLRSLADADPTVRVVLLPANVGQQRAVMAGLRAATGEVVVVLDADLQDPPEAIPILVERLAGTGVDAVFATRRNRYAGAGRTITGRAFKWLLRRIVPIPPGAGSFVAMRRPLVDRILAMPAPRPYLAAMVGAASAGIGAVDVPRDRRADGRSAWTGGMRLRAAAAALYDARVTWRTTWS